MASNDLLIIKPELFISKSHYNVNLNFLMKLEK